MKQIFKKLVLLLAMVSGLTVSVHKGVWQMEVISVRACDWDDSYDDYTDDGYDDYSDDYYDDYADDDYNYWYEDGIPYYYDENGDIEGDIEGVVITPNLDNYISLDYLIYLLDNYPQYRVIIFSSGRATNVLPDDIFGFKDTLFSQKPFDYVECYCPSIQIIKKK